MIRIIGIDPGLQKTGWGIIEQDGSALRFIGCGQIRTDARIPLSERLARIDEKLADTINQWSPDVAAIEETFVNRNPASALLLGQARGVAVVAAARKGLSVSEYSANLIKKSLVGNGHASKDQMMMMVKVLLPSAMMGSSDEADALAIAICHAHHASSLSRVAG